jgi:hypothetical protein
MPIKLSYKSDEGSSDPVDTIEMTLHEHISISDACEAYKQFLSAVGYLFAIGDAIEFVRAEEPEEVTDSWGESITAMDRAEQMQYSSEYDDEKYHIHMGNLQLGLGDDEPADKLVEAYRKVAKMHGFADKMHDPDYVGDEYAAATGGRCKTCKCGDGK